MRVRAALAVLPLLLAACGGGGGEENKVELKQPAVVYDPPVASSSVLPAVDDTTWDETAVRKVLHTFAFGGFASDEQIRQWADMSPQAAIVEILTFDSYNPKLSPTTDADPLNGTDRSLRALAAYWSGSSSPLPSGRRAGFKIDSWRGPQNTAILAAGLPGINPVPHRITLWEINYHLVANLEADVTRPQMAYYYETIQKSLAAREPYQNTLAAAAASVAVSRQYKHFRNFYDIKNSVGVFSGNEDFAREYHQLFFGILGTQSSNDTANDYHEIVTIKNTAKLLTDMTLANETDNELTFGTARHHTGALEVLHQSITGATAKEKINALAQLAIEHAESKQNLPVMIVRGLANDELSESDAQELRLFWSSMFQKDLLLFLRSYAISTQFHSPQRVKYWTPLERNLLYANLTTHGQDDVYINFYDPAGITDWQDGYVLFEPEHNVFGHTTGVETAQSGERFLQQFNRAANEYWRLGRVTDNSYPNWMKDWSSRAPKTAEGAYEVKSVAEWLWQRFMADSLKNFGPLERLHLYALLATGRDAAVACAADPTKIDYDKIFTSTEAASDSAALACRDTLSARLMDLASTDRNKKIAANARIGLAINFMTALPYAMVQEGR